MCDHGKTEKYECEKYEPSATTGGKFRLNGKVAVGDFGDWLRK